MNERQLAALADFRAAYEFLDRCLDDDESASTGALRDATEWLKNAERELYFATTGMSV